MKLAITSIAVSASIRASASEAALLVATFMRLSLEWGHDSSLRQSACDNHFYSEHPATSIRLTSPHSANIAYQNRILMRRQFDSLVTTLAKASAPMALRDFTGSTPC